MGDEVLKGGLYLTDLIDVKVLQEMQDAFSKLTGIASLTADINGVAVTEGSNFSDFCMLHTRKSELGCIRCEQCDRMGAEVARDNGSVCVYFCHAGLVDFAAPIMMKGQMIGCFIGGQVLTRKPDLEKIRRIARELEIDEEEYVEAVKKVKILPKDEIDKAAQFLYTISNIYSSMAYNQHMLDISNKEIERVSQMKSDFLANMSHEIRTPMNAVIGMAQMALREELPPAARDYIHQIKNSGQALLTIINDILDFSKIESGKMDILPVSYSPITMLREVAHIIASRVEKKNVEFTMDIPTDLPKLLYGDNVRVKQILINTLNNAVKFTQHGNVHLKIEWEKLDDENILLRTKVSDTGIGIKKEDMGKLFHSFEQLDSKRNRAIEGTGLGLAITKQLLSLMDGTIEVESEYGKGSVFTFELPQKVMEWDAVVTTKPNPVRIAILISNVYIKKQLMKDLDYLNLDYTELSSSEELPLQEPEAEYLFVERMLFTEKVQEYLKENKNVTGVLLTEYSDTMQYLIPNLNIVKKPVYSVKLNSFLRGEEYGGEEETDQIDFIAPRAEILIVDDNEVNLKVTQGLLEPLQMKMDLACSGKEAVSKISQKQYDLIFMDHMMPEIDGVETTHIIRRFYENYAQVPIIALTANAVDGTREMFLAEEMNDFVPKPVEMKNIVAKLRQWLPYDKIVPCENPGSSDEKVNKEKSELGIEGLDVEKALDLLGSEKLFWSVLKEYYRCIDKKHEVILSCMREKKWKEYTIEVHALKSTSRQIGAMKLADKAERLEKAGNEGDVEFIMEHTNHMLLEYMWYKDVLTPYFNEEEEKVQQDKNFATKDVLTQAFADLRSAMEELDCDKMEDVISELSLFKFKEEEQELFTQLKEAVEEIDTEKCSEILDWWEKKQ